MRNNPSLKGLIIALIAVILAFGTYYFFLAKKNYYIVDNPTNNTYYFKINGGDQKIISAGQTVQVSLKKGDNKILVMDAQKNVLFDSAFQVNKIRGLVNIAHQDYYVHTQYYGYGLNRDSLLMNMSRTTIDGKEYLGSPKKINKLYTDDFYYNADEEYDEVIKNIQKVESRSKIFRKQDFLNYYKQYYKL